jgi:hypothetical protein
MAGRHSRLGAPLQHRQGACNRERVGTLPCMHARMHACTHARTHARTHAPDDPCSPNSSKNTLEPVPPPQMLLVTNVMV